MTALIVVMCVLSAGLALASLRRIPEDTVCTVHRFGRYVRTLTPGVRFTLPLVDRIAHRVSLVGHQVELRGPALAGGALYFQILEPERAGDALDDVDAMVEREACRRLEVMAGEPHDDAAPELGQRLKTELNQQFGTLGLRVTRCQLQTAA